MSGKITVVIISLQTKIHFSPIQDISTDISVGMYVVTFQYTTFDFANFKLCESSIYWLPKLATIHYKMQELLEKCVLTRAQCIFLQCC